MQVKRQRRVHGAEFKAQVLSECQELGASVAGVALRHGLNANLVRSWLRGRGLKRGKSRAVATASRVEPQAAPALKFLPIDLGPASAASTGPVERESRILIELSKGQTTLSVQWPTSQAATCGTWLRDLVAVAR